MTAKTEPCTHPEEARMYNPYTGELTCFECMEVLEDNPGIPAELRKEWSEYYVSKVVSGGRPFGITSYMAQELLKARQRLAAIESEEA
jgi:hypothetical protein